MSKQMPWESSIHGSCITIVVEDADAMTVSHYPSVLVLSQLLSIIFKNEFRHHRHYQRQKWTLIICGHRPPWLLFYTIAIFDRITEYRGH